MDLLSDYIVDVRGVRAWASAPELGDVRAEPYDFTVADPRRVSLGVSAQDIEKFVGLEGASGMLTDLSGEEIARFRLEEIDLDSDLIIGILSGQPAQAISNAPPLG